MKKFLPTIGVGVLLLTVFSALVINNKTYNYAPVNTQTPLPMENTSSITPVDTSMWKPVKLHQNIHLLIPDGWSAGSDGIYNYDYTKVTGIRDPNFPDNSFKCVFYADDDLRRKVTVDNEKILNTSPKITDISGRWNDESENTLRMLGEAVNIYTYNGGSGEKYIECNVFKGEIQADDRNKLENVILMMQ